MQSFPDIQQTIQTTHPPKNLKKIYPFINKSTLTNLLALFVIVLGYLIPQYSIQLKSIGFFALSGAITNWLAIHMLFEKVPGLYGSGVIPNRFEEFKEGIRALIEEEFFSLEKIKNLFQASPNDTEIVDFHPLIQEFDYTVFFDKLVSSIKESPLSTMLTMFGGESALQPIKKPFIEKVKEALSDLSKQPSFQKEIKNAIHKNLVPSSLKARIDDIIQKRLDELSPEMVKKIIQNMIQIHLGWLVVWGGVFGGIIGLFACLF